MAQVLANKAKLLTAQVRLAVFSNDFRSLGVRADLKTCCFMSRSRACWYVENAFGFVESWVRDFRRGCVRGSCRAVWFTKSFSARPYLLVHMWDIPSRICFFLQFAIFFGVMTELFSANCSQPESCRVGAYNLHVTVVVVHLMNIWSKQHTSFL